MNQGPGFNEVYFQLEFLSSTPKDLFLQVRNFFKKRKLFIFAPPGVAYGVKFWIPHLTHSYVSKNNSI